MWECLSDSVRVIIEVMPRNAVQLVDRKMASDLNYVTHSYFLSLAYKEKVAIRVIDARLSDVWCFFVIAMTYSRLKRLRVEAYFNRIFSEGISASRLTDNVQFHEAHEPSLLRGEE